MNFQTGNPRATTRRSVSASGVRESEQINFFWHCRIATMLHDELPLTTVRNAVFVEAVRMATHCHLGANGVQYASQAAIDAAGPAPTRKWSGKDLTKEHVVPVAVIAGFVREALDQPPPVNGSDLSGLDEAAYPTEVTRLFREQSRAWQMARVVRDWTLMAWITREENDRFSDKARHSGKSIAARMPSGWTRDHCRFKRYTDCDIHLLPLV